LTTTLLAHERPCALDGLLLLRLLRRTGDRMKKLRVVLFRASVAPHDWCAQGLEHGYGRVGSTLSLCIERFMDGVHLNHRIHMIDNALPAGPYYHNMWASCNDHVIVTRGGFELHFGKLLEKKASHDSGPYFDF
jgi:hypothetical protein